MKKGGARLGQHFLTARWAAASLAASVAHRGETIFEIGPGKGVLTRELLKGGAHVVAVEKDEALAESLRETFAKEISSGQLRLITGDVRDVAPETVFDGPYVVAANIPYYITGEILRQFLSARHQPRALALLVQKEVAQRIVAKKESILSLSVQVYGKPRIIAKVSRKSFSPPPKVDSAILLIEHVSRDFFHGIDEEMFFKIVHAGFSSKRKMLIGNLSPFAERAQLEALFGTYGIPLKTRAEDVGLEQWRHLVRDISSY
jgi:16S rRNA (adenine1518-N6/adenine1519-N6)-dimethyltransferase